MNPHTDHPDEGQDPSDRTAGQPAGQPAGPPAEASGADQRPAADGSPTTPVDTSATLPLDFSAGAGAGTGAGAGAGTPPPPPPPYFGATPPPRYGRPRPRASR